MKRITRDRVTCLLSEDAQPVEEIAPGEPVVFETQDAVGGRITTREEALRVTISRDEGNPATGPVTVVGAEPGDTLAIEILDIQLGSYGYGRVKGGGVIYDELDPPEANITPVRDGMIQFNRSLRFAARPMVGVVGTAPADEPVATFYPGPHGGNLDINAAGIGSTVYLPVAAPGALLAIGDVHARMGDGELTGGGLDIEAEVTVKTSIERGLGWQRPVIETPDAWCACANAPILEEAIRQATSDMTTLIAKALAMNREEAFILIGAAGDARIGQAASLGMDCTAYLRMTKEILPTVFP
ncbi:MAG TPA: acetamidase/formamidase family protein [Armatimonadota bacterium]|nr:acetamidase/formamidase family protein [Armatimonadota bacterium]